MKITQEVREFARLHDEKALSLDGRGLGEGDASASPTPADPEAGMAEMSKRFHDEGGELYIGANGREHD
jgi:phosphomethylpyrimidine synthase